jgi:pyrimidine 5'-nucleotidase
LCCFFLLPFGTVKCIYDSTTIVPPGSKSYLWMMLRGIQRCWVAQTSLRTTTTDHNIDKYFQEHLGLSQEEANELHFKYYKEYGLAIEGLVRHHKVDALEYNSKVDDALPLEEVIKPNPELRKLIQDIDTNKVRLWLFTNAYITHGKRVVKLLKVDDLFEGMTYCDYAQAPFYCKPHVEMFDKAMKEAGIKSNEKCYFVGKSKKLIFINGSLI